MDFDINSLTTEEVITLCKSHSSHNTLGPGLVRVSQDVIIKFGVDITMAEFENQRYIWEKRDMVSFRVPRPYLYFRDDDSEGPHLSTGYMIMEFIHGTQLSEYLETANDGEWDEVAIRMLKVIEDLRDIPQPRGQSLGPVGGGLLRGYLWSECGLNHAFQDVAEFENFHNSIIEKTYGSENRLSFNSHDLVLCHMDLAPRNIIRSFDGSLTLLDWAYAGFYPPIFEVYALKTRSNREPIFATILGQIPHGTDTEQQIALLGLIEAIFLRWGDTINQFVENSCVHTAINLCLSELEQKACLRLATSDNKNEALLDF